MTKGNTTLIKKRPKQSNGSKQLRTHILPTNDVENNSTNKGRYLQLGNKPWVVP